ncbi:MAG: hypothetical protein Tsb0014_15660 [Pleurocapsa sp.]
MSDLVKGIVKTYKAYKTFKWIAIGGSIIASGGALAIPLIASEIAEQLAEQGIAELASGAAEKLFDITVENIDGEKIFKLGEETIKKVDAEKLLAAEYLDEMNPALKVIASLDAAAFAGSIDLLISTDQAEKEDVAEQENKKLANFCFILINNFWLADNERDQLKKQMSTILEISDILEQHRMLQRLLTRLRQSDKQNTHGRDLFDDNTGNLNLSFT